jgi:predicted RNA binding protein YcfA (HicA-like mRNA interferase family)
MKGNYFSIAGKSYFPTLTISNKFVTLDIMKVREIIKLIEKNGWVLARQKGSHKTFTHPTKTGIVTVPEHGGDIPIGTLNSILKQVGLKRGK